MATNGRHSSESSNTDVEALEQEAAAVRERLLAAVDELDEKRHALIGPSSTLRKAAIPAGIVGGVLLAAGATTLIIRARRQSQYENMSRFKKFFQPRPAPSSFWKVVARRAGMAIAAFAIAEAGKFAVRKVSQMKSDSHDEHGNQESIESNATHMS